MKRGIIIGTEVKENDGFSMDGGVNSADLMKWLLYWDNITFANFEYKGVSIFGKKSNDIEYLSSTGIFNSVTVNLDDLKHSDLPIAEPGIIVSGIAGNQMSFLSAAARVKLTNQLTNQENEIWSMGQYGGEKLLLPGINTTLDLIDIKLINCLPVPKANTALDDILSFKRIHQAELERLRYATDILREKILSSSDEKRAIESAVYEIAISLNDIRKALHGNGVSTLSETISLYTENPALSFWTAMGGLATAGAAGVPVELGIAAGIGLPTVCKFIKRSITGGQNLPDPKNDFTYAYEITKQLN